MPRVPLVVKNLLIINGLFFVATLVISQGFMVDTFGAHYFDSHLFRVWQPVTYMFMHGGLLHILFNMYAVFLFGSAVESVWGPKRFLQYYILTGLGALALHMGVQAFEFYQISGSITSGCEIIGDRVKCPDEQAFEIFRMASTPIVGASGAVFGLLLAFGMMFPNVELMLIFLPIPIKAKYFVIGYGVLELFQGVARFEGDSVAHYAHIGGMLFGYILIKGWKGKWGS